MKFYPIGESSEASTYLGNFDNFKGMESIFNCFRNYINDDIKNAFYHTRKLLNNTRKKYMKHLYTWV